MCHQLFASLGYRNNNKLIKMARSIIKILCLGLFSRAFLYTLLLVFLLSARICFWLYFSCWLCQCCLLLCLYFFFKQLHMKENLGNWVGMSKTQRGTISVLGIIVYRSFSNTINSIEMKKCYVVRCSNLKTLNKRFLSDHHFPLKKSPIKEIVLYSLQVATRAVQ